MARMRRRDFWKQQAQAQEAWMAERGGNLAGYVTFYGSAADPKHYGDGGEAIYAADLAALERAQERARD